MRRARIPLILVLSCLVGTVHAAPSRTQAAAVAADTQTISAALRKEAGGKLKKFYASRGYRPLWAASGRIGPEAGTLLGYLEDATLDGLKPLSYNPGDLREAIAAARSGGPAEIARAELVLSAAFARYAADMRRPANVGMRYLDKRLKPKKLSADAVLRAASLPKSFGGYLGKMGWMSPHYVEQRRLLSKAIQKGRPSGDLDRIRLNRERARILPGPWTHHVVVDAASGRLWYYQAGDEKGEMKVVVGKHATPTPMMAGMLSYAILNPYWNIPVDLAQTLIAPKVLAGRSLKSLRIEALSDWSATPAKLDPATIDWNAVAAGARELRLRELPGGANSMGRVKFMFPNDHGIYLHDTPDRDLFAKENRHFSNGCIRLENAAALGQWLLGRSIRAGSSAPEQAVALPVPVPVYLTYFTATETKSGIAFRDDVYGRDL